MALVATALVWIRLARERQRSQPLVIVNEAEPPRLRSVRAGWEAFAFVTNEGDGTAFNVRFGIEISQSRWPFRHDGSDSDLGTAERLLRAGARLPDSADGALELSIPSEAMWAALHPGAPKDFRERRAYWCRYENALGETWETHNPWRRSGDLVIRRVRWPRLRARRERRARERARQRGLRVEETARSMRPVRPSR